MPELTDEQIAAATASVKAVTTPETFNFAEAVSDRSYPEFDVEVYLDEKNIQRFIKVHDERALLEQKIAASDKPSVQQAEALEALDKAYNEVRDDLASKRYVIKIRGISPEENIALDAKAIEAFPIETIETTNPMTGALLHEEKENDQRDAYYATLIRQAHIVSVTAPNGAVDTDFSDPAKVQVVMQRLPHLARERVDQAIQDATITADFYRVLVDPVF